MNMSQTLAAGQGLPPNLALGPSQGIQSRMIQGMPFAPFPTQASELDIMNFRRLKPVESRNMTDDEIRGTVLSIRQRQWMNLYQRRTQTLGQTQGQDQDLAHLQSTQGPSGDILHIGQPAFSPGVPQEQARQTDSSAPVPTSKDHQPAELNVAPVAAPAIGQGAEQALTLSQQHQGASPMLEPRGIKRPHPDSEVEGDGNQPVQTLLCGPSASQQPQRPQSQQQDGKQDGARILSPEVTKESLPDQKKNDIMMRRSKCKQWAAQGKDLAPVTISPDEQDAIHSELPLVIKTARNMLNFIGSRYQSGLLDETKAQMFFVTVSSLFSPCS
jgi:hypothetical protein